MSRLDTANCALFDDLVGDFEDANGNLDPNFVRKVTKIKRTPQNKGVELTIKVILYGDGMANLNGYGYGHDKR